MRKLTLIIGLVCFLSSFILVAACADEDEYGSRKNLGLVDDPIYKEECGACHFAYQPALLPSGSWRKILSSLEDHHGESAAIAEEDIGVIGAYLEKNAAEFSPAKRARKIIRSLDGQTPERITEVPYIRRKHHEIKEEVFKRESIGSRSNCVACHSTAEHGVYEDDYAHIPE
jgi:hypothetical protein